MYPVFPKKETKYNSNKVLLSGYLDLCVFIH